MRKIHLNKVDWNDSILEDEDLGLDHLIVTADEGDKDLNSKIEYYMNLNYSIKLDKIADESGEYWIAEHPELSGCKTHANTRDEALARLDEVKKTWIFSKLISQEEMPLPSQMSFEECSGKFLLRLPKELHYKIIKGAEKNNTSINQYMIYLITESFSRKSFDLNLVLTPVIESITELKNALVSESKFDTGYLFEVFNRRLGGELSSIPRQSENRSPKHWISNESELPFVDFTTNLQ